MPRKSRFGVNEIKQYFASRTDLNKRQRTTRQARLWKFFESTIQQDRLDVMIRCAQCGTANNKFPCPRGLSSGGGREPNHVIVECVTASVVAHRKALEDLAFYTKGGHQLRQDIVDFIESLQ